MIVSSLVAFGLLYLVEAHPGRPPFRPRFVPAWDHPFTQTNHKPLCFPQVPLQYPRSQSATLAHPSQNKEESLT